jgi:hypothetical protein
LGWLRRWFLRLRRRRRSIGRLDKRQAQPHQRLFEQTRLLRIEVSLGFGLEHFQLVNEKLVGVQVEQGLAGFRMRRLA